MFTKSNPLYKRWCASKEKDVVESHKLEVKPPTVIPPEPKVEEAKVEEAKVEEAKVEEAKVEEAKVEEVKVEEAKVEEPVEPEPESESKPEEAKVEFSIKIEEIPSDTELSEENTGIVEEYDECYSEKLKGGSEYSPFKDKGTDSDSSIKETKSEEEERVKEEREYEEQEKILLEEKQRHYAEQMRFAAMIDTPLNLFYMKEEHSMPVARLRPVDNKGQNDAFGNKKNKWGH